MGGDSPVFGRIAYQRLISVDLDLVAPEDADSRHVVVQQVLLLVVAQHHQDVQVRVVQRLGEIGDGILVAFVPIQHLLRGDFLGDAVYVRFLHQSLKISYLAVEPDKLLVPFVVLAPL